MAKGLIKVLGSGSSGGVPLVTGYWGNCDPSNPKNRRMRASIAVEYNNTTLMVDTGPDFHAQTLTFGVKDITAILYTHAHSDHVNGVDELRYLKHVQGHLIDAYGDIETLSILQNRFAHVFAKTPDGLYDAVVNPIAFKDTDYNAPQTIGDITFTPFYQTHGYGRSVGYRFGDFGYSTDVSELDDTALNTLKGIKTWLVDCAQYGTDYTLVHADLAKVMRWNETIGAPRVILTHLTPRLDYETLKSELPSGYEPAYDGLEIEFNLPD